MREWKVKKCIRVLYRRSTADLRGCRINVFFFLVCYIRLFKSDVSVRPEDLEKLVASATHHTKEEEKKPHAE